MPRFSIIMPVYNSEKYLPFAIESIVQQDFTNYELILVDDGSTDTSPQICDNYAKVHSQIHAHHIPNGGLCHARNYGMSLATGEYLGFCDNDDNFHPDFFSSIDKKVLATDKNPDIVCFGRQLEQYSSEGTLLYSSNIAPSATALFSGEDIYVNYKYWTETSDGVWCHLYDRAFIESNSIKFDESLKHGSEDILFNIESLSHANTILYVNETYYTWIRRESHSTSMGIYADTLDGIKRALDAEVHLLQKHGVDKNDPTLFGKQIMENIIFQMTNVRRKSNPSFSVEKTLYAELRKLLEPYWGDIKTNALPAAYQLEIFLLKHKMYALLYWILISTKDKS